MHRQRPVSEPYWGEQPAFPVAVHDERPVAGDGVHPSCILVRAVRRRLVSLEVRYVVAGPLAPLLVPPDVLLAFAPGFSFRVGRGPVVEDSSVHRPRPAPLVVRVVPWPAVAGLVLTTGVDAGVDPTPASRRTVVLEIGEPSNGFSRLDLVAAYLLEDALDVRLIMVALCRIVPGQRLYGPVAVLPRALVDLLHPASQVEDEPAVAPRFPWWVHSLVVPLEHSLGLGEGAVLLGH